MPQVVAKCKKKISGQDDTRQTKAMNLDSQKTIASKLVSLREEFRKSGATNELEMKLLELINQSVLDCEGFHSPEVRESARQLYREVRSANRGYRVETIPLTSEHPKIGTRLNGWRCVRVEISDELQICEVAWKRLPDDSP